MDDLENSRMMAVSIWQKTSDAGDTSYFEKKGIEPVPGVKYGKDEKGNPCAVVPYCDIEGSLQTAFWSILNVCLILNFLAAEL